MCYIINIKLISQECLIPYVRVCLRACVLACVWMCGCVCVSVYECTLLCVCLQVNIHMYVIIKETKFWYVSLQENIHDYLKTIQHLFQVLSLKLSILQNLCNCINKYKKEMDKLLIVVRVRLRHIQMNWSFFINYENISQILNFT